MPEITGSRAIGFGAKAVYGIVIDVEMYPSRLPFIRRVEIIERQPGMMKARVAVGLPMLSFSYECLISYEPDRLIEVSLIEGPLKRLNATWRFEPTGPDTCIVHYRLDSEFRNPLFEKTAGAIFAARLAHSIRAFEEVLKRS